MTTEERAERIAAFLDEHNVIMTDDEWILFKKEIVGEINEAKLDAHAFHDGETLQSYREGKALAYEDAAKIVETEHKVCLPLMCETAKKIRARAKEIK